MATKSKVKVKKKSVKGSTTRVANEQFIVSDLSVIGKEKYYKYGISVLEDRAFPDYRDGMPPVRRRVLWAAHKMGINHKSPYVKSARIVGDAMGRFHPHGDASIYKSLVGMAKGNSSVSFIDGSGNFGTYSDQSYAAMRYTESRLSAFTDAIMFDKFYTPCIEYVPNYDSKELEPLLLPVLLPVLFLNGASGVAPGATTEIPAFTYPSVLAVLKAAYSGEELTPKLLYQTLKFKSRYGGVEHKLELKEAKTDRLAVFKGTKGKVVLHSNLTLDIKNRTIKVDKFANLSQIENVLTKLQAVPGVKNTSSTFPMDTSSKHDIYGEITIPLEKQTDAKAYQKVYERVEKALTSNENFFLNFTERYIDDTGQAQARVHPLSITEALTKWIAWRIELERKACRHWIKEHTKAIAHLMLMMLAVDNRKLIIESLDKDLDQDALEVWLGKKLKISKEDAHTIYQLRVIQLRKLEKKTLMTKRKEIEAVRRDLEQRHKKPQPYMLKQLGEFAKLA